MRKTLRFLLLSLLMMICGIGFAQTTVTFIPATDNVKGQSDVTVLSKDNITLKIEKNTASSTGTFGRDDQYRIYKGNTLTISSSAGNIQKVEFTCTASDAAQYGPGNFTDATVGEYAYSDKVGTWTGDVASFTITASGAQVRATQIVVTLGAANPDAVATPSIEGVDKFETTADVTITGAEGTTIYYTTDGTEPTTSSVNTGASPVKFTVSETTTVKAIAAKDGKVSAVAEKTFTKVAYRKYVKATAVEAGKSYLIVSGGKVALPISGNYGYLYVVDGNETNGVISQETADNEFTFEAVNGGYKIKQQNGKYLYMKGTYNSFNVGAETTENDVWTVTANADGTFKIENVGMTKYIQYSTQYTSYGCYADVQGDMPYLYVIDDTATGINSVESNVNNSNAIYNMAGQRLQKLQKGMNIVGGKKVVVK